MKGRNSTVVSIRIPDSVYAMIKDKAKGLSVPDYIKDMVIRSVDAMDSQSINPSVASGSVNAMAGIPFYDPLIHKAGDKVWIWRLGKQVEITVP